MSKQKLNTNERHEILINLLNEINTKLNNFQDFCNHKFTELNTKIHTIQCNSSMQNSMNFTKVDNKEEFLNINVTNVISKDVILYLSEQSKNYIKHQNIYDILNKTYDIYDLICNIVSNINKDFPEKCFYTFPYQKNIIYVWNFQNQTWEKCSNDLLKKIFNKLQYNILECYNNLIQKLQQEKQFHKKYVKFMESANLLFVDNFDQKVKLFKKSLFNTISN